MPLFNTRYGPAIVRVLNAYPPNSRSLIVALEALLTTAMNRKQEESRHEISEATCRNLHPDAADGLICLKCFDTMEMGKTPSEEEEVASAQETADNNEIRQQVEMLIGETDE